MAKQHKPLYHSLAAAAVEQANNVVTPARGRLGQRWTESHQDEFLNVDVETLIDDPYFIGMPWDKKRHAGLYPCHKDDILAIWEMRKQQKVNYAIDVEGIGSGKTTKFAVILWLLMYELICKMSAQRYYSLHEGQDIALICMSRDAMLARRVTFRKVLPLFNCPFFLDYFPPVNVDIQRVLDEKTFPRYLRFPKNLLVFPGTSSEAAAMGFDVFGGALDEANHCQVVDKSRKASKGSYTVFDAAEVIYSSIQNRMTSRFPPNVKQDFFFYVCSNVNHPEDFCERHIRDVVLHGVEATRTMVFRRSLWDAKPWAYSKKRIYFDTDTLKEVTKAEYLAQFKERAV